MTTITAAVVAALLAVAADAAADTHDAAQCVEPSHRLPDPPQYGWVRFENGCEVPVMVAWCIPPEVQHDYDWDADPRCGDNPAEDQPYYTDIVDIEPDSRERVLYQYVPTHWAACYGGMRIESDAEGRYRCQPVKPGFQEPRS